MEITKFQQESTITLWQLKKIVITKTS